MTSDERKLITHHLSLWLRFRLGLAEAGDFITGFALTALFKERGAFKTLKDIALAAQS